MKATHSVLPGCGLKLRTAKMPVLAFIPVLLATLLLLLSHFSRVWLCATPETAAHQAPPSLGFSRQEHWSGLPFPSPMHESEKWKWSRSVVSNSQRPHGLQPIRLLHPWDFPGKSTGVGCHCLLRAYVWIRVNKMARKGWLLSNIWKRMTEQLRRITYHDVALHSKRRHATSRNETFRCEMRNKQKTGHDKIG